ncbi:unnamed protein product, partial [Effrenium voratum]
MAMARTQLFSGTLFPFAFDLQLAGLITDGAWSTMATLPEECRPKKDLIFSTSNGNNDLRIDVRSRGTVEYGGSGQRDNNWQSLTGIIFTTKADDQQSISLHEGWTIYGGDWTPPVWSVVEGMCVLEGMIKRDTGGQALATLPVDCWPMSQLLFNARDAERTSRVDITPEGILIAGRQSARWISLSGIAFPQSPGGIRMLPLRSNWVRYDDDGTYGYPTFTVRNGICVVDAMLKDGSWASTLAQLPSNCRPSKSLIFAANNHDGAARVDVQVPGAVKHIRGSANHGWVSLSNIIFAPGSLGHIALPLVSPWVGYGGSFGTPDYTVRNGVCSVEGMIKGGNWGHLATLPEDCRPSGRLVFAVSNDDNPARVDVLTNGEIRYAGGAKNH